VNTSAQNFLMSGGVKGALFIKGQPVRGRITEEPEVRQQTDFKTKELKFFKSGDPMMQLIVTVATDQRDADNPADDGTRGFYVKNQLTKTVRDAVRAAGARGLEVGGELTLTWVSGGPRYEGDQNWATESPKVFAATYVKPVPRAAAAFLNSADSTPAGLPPLPAPATQSAAIPAPPAGVDPAAWAALSDEQRRQYLALLPA